MSYYRPSFSQAVAMTRGRGFSSSYRGGSGRNSWGGPPERGRGNGYGSSSRGGGGSSGGRFGFSHSVDSRSKYTPASSERYGASTRGDYDDYHHKSYRSELSNSGYPGRDVHRSPDRKRMRPEAPSSRRSHEGDSFNNSSSRYPSNSFPDHRSFSRDRRPTSFSRREEFRKTSGPPPSATPRGGYRGRISSRGTRGARLRDGPPRRRLMENSYAVRRRLATRIPLDYRRSLKMSRLRSTIIRRPGIRRRVISDKEESDEKAKESEEESKPAKKTKEGSDTEADPENKEKEVKSKSPKKETSTSDKEEKAERSEHEVQSPKKDFIKLLCPHCNSKYITFAKYSLHLHSGRHLTAMRQVALKQKSVLARMRLSQRNAQRELEKTTEDLAPRTNFCPLCKLNYKQPKATHQGSDSHKNMKKFLMPYCRICRVTFKSPMLYETHICSIEHIKRKARLDVNGEKSEREDGSGNDEDNLENFMTIDSVGDVDDEDGKKKDSDEKHKEQINVGIEQIRKVEVQFCDLCRMYLPRVDESELEETLSKHCKQRNHMQNYIRYKEDKEIAMRAERLQRKETAEKEREKKVKEEKKNAEDNTPKDDAEKNGDISKEKTASQDEEEINDDKLWADDVNKDLGDILAEAEGNKSTDEDDDSHVQGERYDRFGYSEKSDEEKKEGETPADEKVKDGAAVTEKKETE